MAASLTSETLILILFVDLTDVLTVPTNDCVGNDRKPEECRDA